MPVNLLSCIITHFNVGMLHVFNVGRMMLHNGRRRFWWAMLRASGLEFGPSGLGGPQSGRDLEIVEDNSG